MLSHPNSSQLPGRSSATTAHSGASCTLYNVFYRVLKIILWYFSGKWPFLQTMASLLLVLCNGTCFSTGSTSAPKCSWHGATICAVIKLNPLLGLALSLNNTSPWVIHSQGTHTSRGWALAVMYGRNTSECTPAVRIYGHHTSSGGAWVLMDGSRDGTVQHWARPGPGG